MRIQEGTEHLWPRQPMHGMPNRLAAHTRTQITRCTGRAIAIQLRVSRCCTENRALGRARGSVMMFTPTSGMNCGHGHAHQRATRTPALAPQPPTRGGPCPSHHYTGKLRQRRPAATATPTPCRRTTPDTRAERDGAPATFWTSRPELTRHLQDPHIETAGPATLWTPAC